MEILRSLFTGQDGQPAALTFEQFLEKLNAAKEIKLANLAEGGYVSVDKFKAEEAKATGLQEQLTHRSESADPDFQGHGRRSDQEGGSRLGNEVQHGHPGAERQDRQDAARPSERPAFQPGQIPG